MKHRVQIRLLYGIFLSVFTVVLGAVLIGVAADIYYAAPEGHPYSRALVGERLSPLIAPFILYVLAVIGGFVLSILFPPQREREKAPKDVTLRRLMERVPAGSGEAFAAERARLKKYESIRIAIWAVCAAAAAAAGVVTVWYLATVSHFSGEITAGVLGMLRVCLPCIGGAFLLFLLAALYEGLTLNGRLACLKKLIALGRGAPLEERSGASLAAERALGVLRSDVAIWVIRGAVLLLGITFLVLGIVNGGAGDVYLKAIKICTECIGLG